MTNKREVLLELERRGKLPPKYAPILNEMRSRGMIESNEKPSIMGSFLRSAGNSLVFDGGDEFLAGIGVGEGDTYSERQRDLQKTIDADYDINPIASYTGNVVGSVVPLAASALASVFSGGAASPSLVATGGKTMASLGKLGAKIASNPKTLAKGLGLAAGEGAVSGYLGADQDTRAMGAGIGAVAGPVGDIAMRGLTKGAQSIKQLFETPALKEQAIKRLSSVIDAAGGEKIVKDNFNKLSSDETMLMDALGGVGGNEARRVGNLDMSVRSDLSNAVLDRHLGGNRRLADVIEDVSGLKSGQGSSSKDLVVFDKNFADNTVDVSGVGVDKRATPQSIVEELDTVYKPKIDRAYNDARLIDKGPQEFIISPEVQNSPVFQKAMRGLDDTIANLKATNPSIDPENPFDQLDALKKNLDDIGYTIENGRSVPAAGVEAKTARDLAKNIRQIADDSFPAYKGARDLHREKVLRQQSTLLGQKLGRRATNRDVIRSFVDDPNIDKEFVKKGYGAQASQSLLDRVQGKRTIDFIDAGNKEAFDQLYSPEQVNAIQKQIGIERAFNDTKNAVTANSTSAAQIADLLGDAATGIGTTVTGVGLGMDGGTSAILGAAASLGKNALRKTFKNRALAKERNMAPHIAKMLMSKQFPQEIIDAQSTAAGNALREQLIRNLLARYASQPASQTAVDVYRENR